MASGPMYLSQQFYLGGLAFGRGYGAAEIGGDNGVAGSLELRFDQKLNYKYWTGFQFPRTSGSSCELCPSASSSASSTAGSPGGTVCVPRTAPH